MQGLAIGTRAAPPFQRQAGRRGRGARERRPTTRQGDTTMVRTTSIAMKLFLGLALVFSPCFLPSTARADDGNGDMKKDREDIKKDREDIKKDREQLRQDLKNGDKADAKKLREEIRKDRKDIHKDKEDLRKDERKRHHHHHHHHHHKGTGSSSGAPSGGSSGGTTTPPTTK